MTVRKTLPDLQPNTQYAIRVRATNFTDYSDWSVRETFTTIADAIPISIPTGVTWVVNGDAFHGEWNAVTTNTNGDTVSVVRYEVQLVAGVTTKVVSVTPNDASSKVTFDLSYAANVALFGTPQPAITMSVRSVDNHELKSSYSTGILATNAAPAPPTSPVVTAGTDSLDISWTPPADTDLIGYNVYVGASSGFTPSGANRVFTGNATRFTYTSTTYTLQFFKIRAVDKFNQESTDLLTSGTPVSPFIADVTAPATPTLLAGTITNNANGIGASSAMTWTMGSPPADLAGFNIRYRKTGATPYLYQSGIDSAARASTIILDTAYQNYEFQIQAYDFSGNQSAFSSTVTVTSPANAAPANVTGLASVAGNDSIIYTWTPVADTDIKNYEFTFSTSPTFASGNITYLNGTSTTLNVGGLAYNTTYYGRVRAVDTGGLTSVAFSSTDTKTTGISPVSDGSVPASSPTPSVIGELGWLLVTWTAVANADAVTYEVHLSTTTGFTPSGATKVTEVSGTAAAIDTLPGTTTPLTYGTTYFIKLIAKDRDGSAAAGAQGSGTPVKIAATDSTLVAADVGAYTTSATDTLLNGKNKVTWSASDPGATANLAGDVWFTMSAGLVSKQWQGTGGTSWTQVTLQDTVIASVAAGKITAGTVSAVTIQVASTGSIQSTDYSAGSAGWKLSTGGLEVRSGVIAANTIISGTGIVNNLIVQSGGAVQSSNYSAGVAGYKISQLGIEMNDTGSTIKVEALKAGTIGGGSGAGVIQVAAGTSLVFNGGYLKSNTNSGTTYATAVTSGAGFYLGNDGLFIGGGTINAGALVTGTISGTNTITLSGANAHIVGTGFDLSGSGLSVTSGTIAAAALTIQTGANLLPPAYADFELNANYYTTGLTLFAGTATVDTVDFRFNKQSLKWSPSSTFNTIVLGTSNTDYNAVIPPGDYIISYYAMIKTGGVAQSIQPIIRYQTAGSNGTVNGTNQAIPANSTWARYSTVVTVPGTATGGAQLYYFSVLAGVVYLDGIQVEAKISGATTPSTWSPPGATTIIGDMIRTGSIISSAVATVMKVVPTYDATGNIIGYGTPVLVNDPNSRPAWSVNAAGAATFSNLAITGNVVVGDPTTVTSTQNVNVTFNSTVSTPLITLTSGNFYPSDVGQSFTGPNIPGGATVLTYLTPTTANLSANATLTASAQAGVIVRPIRYTTQIASANYIQGSSGWMMRSDGYAEFLQLAAQSISGAAIKAGTLSADAITTGTIDSDISLSGSFKTSIGYAGIDFNTTNASPTVTTTTGQFYPDDVGVLVVGANIPAGATIIAYSNATQITISANATATASDADGQIFRGRQVIIDSSGISLLSAIGDVITNLPTDPSTSSTFTGSVTAQSILVQDLFQMQGTNNILSSNSQLTISGGSYVPGTAPIVSFSYTKSTLTSGATNIPYSPAQDDFVNNPAGLFYDDTTKQYYFIYNLFGGYMKRFWASGGAGGPVYQANWDVDLTHGFANGTDDIPHALSADATNFFFLTKRNSNSNWRLQRITRTGINRANGPLAGDLTSNVAWDETLNSGISGFPGVAVYGGDTYIAKINTNSKIVLYKYTGVANLSTLAFSTVKGDIVSGDVTSVTVGKFDMGGTNVYAVVTVTGPTGGRSNYVYLVGVSSFGVSNLNFPVADDKDPIGTVWHAATTDTSAGNFQTVTMGGDVYDYTGLAGTTTGTAIKATIAWRNSSATVGIGGVGTQGPTGSYTMRRRSIMTVKSPQAIPNTGGTSPNSIAFWAGVDAGTKWRYPDPADNSLSITATALQTSNSTALITAARAGDPLQSGVASVITNGVNLTISGSGDITTNPVPFGYRTHTTLQSLTSGTKGGINFTTAGAGDTSTTTFTYGTVTIGGLTASQWTTTRAGRYLVTAGIAFATTSTVGRRFISIMVNGADYVIGNTLGTSINTTAGNVLASATMNCAVGTTISIGAFQNSGGALNTDATATASFCQVIYLGS